MKQPLIIIMAGGIGKRMKSDIPKVLHKLHNIPMIVRVIRTSLKVNPIKILIVVGKFHSIIESSVNQYLDEKITNQIEYIDQPEALGTGHAIKCCLTKIKEFHNTPILVLSGDVPLVSKETMIKTLHNLNYCRIVVARVVNPKGLGRIILSYGKFNTIIEEKDCKQSERKINLVNTGVYGFDSNILSRYLPSITNNNSQNEYYLTDIIEIIKSNENVDIEMYKIPEEKLYELTGVNTPEQLSKLENLYLSK